MQAVAEKMEASVKLNFAQGPQIALQALDILLAEIPDFEEVFDFLSAMIKFMRENNQQRYDHDRMRRGPQ